MDATTNFTAARISHASPLTGREGDEVRALATSEVDGVAGGSLLHAIGGLAGMAFVLAAWGDDIEAALTELEEWIKS